MLYSEFLVKLIKDDEEFQRLHQDYQEAKKKLMHYLQNEGIKIEICKKAAPGSQHQAQLKGIHEMSDDEIKEFARRFSSAIHDMYEEEQ